MRLQKYLALCGAASRRQAEQMIKDGLVAVNGVVIQDMGVKVEAGDTVTLRGKVMKPEAEKRYVLYYKPVGEVTSVSDPEGRPTVLDRFKGFPVRIYPVGRLDFDSEGLLILTNDGDLTARLTHPRYEVDKGYLVRVSLQPDHVALRQLRDGVVIEGRKTAPAKVLVAKKDAFSTDLVVTIHEGRNRQIRRMVEAVGHQVIRLKRVSYGPVNLGGLKIGEWRDLTDSEVTQLKQAAGM